MLKARAVCGVFCSFPVEPPTNLHFPTPDGVTTCLNEQKAAGRGLWLSARLTKAVPPSWLFPWAHASEVLSFYGKSLATLRHHAGEHVETKCRQRCPGNPCCSSACSLPLLNSEGSDSTGLQHHFSPSHQLPIITRCPSESTCWSPATHQLWVTAIFSVTVNLLHCNRKLQERFSQKQKPMYT